MIKSKKILKKTKKTTTKPRYISDYLQITRFIIKDKNKFGHQQDFLSLGNCPENNCTDSYIWGTARISERIIDHNGRDKHFHHFKNANEYSHTRAGRNEFKILNKGFRNITIKRKISEALCNS